MRFYPPAAAATFWDLRIYTDIHYDNACAEGDAEDKDSSCTDAEIADADPDVEDAADDDIADKNATTHVGAHPRDGRTREDRATQPLDCWKAAFCNKNAGIFNL